MTVAKIERPRPRTHSGSATWADTLRVASTAIHATPAMRLAASAVAGWRATPNRDSASAVPMVPAIASLSAPSLRFSRENERAADGTGTDCTQKDAVERRTAEHLVTRHQRQQGPIGAGEHKEPRGADQGRAQVRIVTRMTQASVDRAAETLGGKAWTAPCGRCHHISAAITPMVAIAFIQNGTAIPAPAMINPANAGPTARLKRVLMRDRGLQLAPGHEARHDRLPRRRYQGRKGRGNKSEIRAGWLALRGRTTPEGLSPRPITSLQSG